MNQSDNSLDDLEKAKQEVLEKLKQLEDLEKSIKEKHNISSPEESSQVVEPQKEETITETPTETPTQPEVVAESETIVEPSQKEATIQEATPKIEPEVTSPPVVKEEEEIISEEKEEEEEEEEEVVKQKVNTPSTPAKKKAEPKKKEAVISKENAKKAKIEAAKKEKSKIKEQEKIERINKLRSREEEQLKNYSISMNNRKKGKVPAEPGNKGIRHTYAEVFVFVVDDNELQLKVLQEQFKNTRSFKNTKGFTNGADLLKYIKTRKFPKMSILLVVMDYFLEDSDDEEAQNGIAILNELKEYDPNIEVIMLSSSSDVDIATSASYFGAVTFIQKGKDAFKKVLNNLVWAIHEQEKIRKKSDTKKMIKIGIIGFVTVIVALLVIDIFTQTLGIINLEQVEEAVKVK